MMTHEEGEKIQALYMLYEQPMYRIAVSVLNDPSYAEDAVSDAFVYLIRNIKKIAAPDSPKTKSYVVKVIKNISIDKYRSRKRNYMKTQAMDESVVLIPDSSIDVENAVLSKEMPPILEKLNETDRNIFMLRCGKELSWKEIAKELSLTETAVRKRFERAKKKLSEERGNV